MSPSDHVLKMKRVIDQKRTNKMESYDNNLLFFILVHADMLFVFHYYKDSSPRSTEGHVGQSMGKWGRFGKYGEIKRQNRLRNTGKGKFRYQGEKGAPVNLETPKKQGDQMGPVVIRECRGADREFISRLSRRAFSIYGPYEETLTEWFDSGLAVTLVAELMKKRAGFAMLGRLVSEESGMARCELVAVAVEPERRKMGIARLLLEKIEKRAARLHVKRLFLHTATHNIPAQQLFIKAGYCPYQTKSRFYPEGQDALAMVKELANSRVGL